MIFLRVKIIIQGYWNWLLDAISDIKYKKYFDDRYVICKECVHSTNSGRCDICNCVLKAKTKSEDSLCPIGKWKTIKETINEEAAGK